MSNQNNSRRETNYPLNKLSSEDFANGANKALANAIEKLEVSKLICENHPATSVSILITSLEELSKALYLKVASHNPKKIHIEQLEKIFYRHERKHEAIGIMFGALIIRKNSSLSATTLVILLAAIGLALAEYFQLKPPYNTLGNGVRNLEFARKRGLYLDLDKESGAWVSPQEYKTTKEVKDYIGTVEALFDDIKTTYFSDKKKPLQELIQSLYDESVRIKK